MRSEGAQWMDRQDGAMVIREEHEPTDLQIAIWDRGGSVGWPYIGPLTQQQAEHEAAYIRHCEKEEREHELERQHGGRTRCPQCDQFTVEHRSVCTLGYPGHPGAEYSDYACCTNCDHKEL